VRTHIGGLGINDVHSGAANARCKLGQTRSIRLNAHQLCK